MKCKHCIAFLLILSLAFTNNISSALAVTKKVKLNNTKITITVGKNKTLQLENSKGAVKRSVNNKKVTLNL